MTHKRIRVIRLFTISSAVSASIALSACATTINSSVNTVASTIATTTTIPRGTSEELLAQLTESMRGLSTAVAEGDRATALSRLSNVQAQWEALRPQLEETPSEIVEDVKRMVDLAASSVLKKRPADADKALLLLPIITEALQEAASSGSP